MTTLATSETHRTQNSLAPPPRTRWNPRSIALIVLAWLVLQLGGIFSPGLLDDVDSIYIEVAREMLQRRDFVTPYINGIRFFDKPPLMYWMAATSMGAFGITDWAARLPLALAVLALLLSTYALGNRLFAAISPAHAQDRGGFYSALALATAIGPYLYTRFFIPDILIALWMTLGIHLFLIALERAQRAASSPALHPERSAQRGVEGPRKSSGQPDRSNVSATGLAPDTPHGAPSIAVSPRWMGLRGTHGPLSSQTSTLLPCLGFAAVLALNVLTKGLIGLAFPVAFALLYLAFTRQLRLIPRFHPVASAAVFLAIAAPWHILAALRNPAIALPSGLGLPARAGWAWFYLYNEHIARFLSRRIPHDYGQTPIWLFWFYLGLWIMPWTTFLPTAISTHIAELRNRAATRLYSRTVREHEAALALLLWAGIVLGFFTLSARQEYYSLPAIPAFTLMAGGLLVRADSGPIGSSSPGRSALRWSVFFLVPIATITAAICAWFALTAPHPAPGATLSALLESNPGLYNLSLGHLFDLTAAALGLFRGPLAAVAAGLVAVGLISALLRWKHHPYAANLSIAAGMTIVLLGAHSGLVRFNPILGSKDLAQTINAVIQPDDLIVLDGELTSGSTLLFYTRRQVHLVDGRVNGLWYGSLWPDAPHVFETDASLRDRWSGPRRVFLLTYHTAERRQELSRIAPAHVLATSGGKSILINFIPRQ